MEFNFTTGDAVELVRLGSHSGISNRFKTMVEKQESADELLLYMPITKGKIVSLGVGEILKMNYVGLDTYNDKYDVYELRVEVTDVVTYDNLSMMYVKRISDVKKVQRRDFFRLDIIKPILIESVDDETSIEVITRDISAGGMQAMSPVELEKDSEFAVYMNIIHEEPIIVIGKVLDCSYSTEIKAGNKYQVRFQFLDVEKSVRGEMVKQINNLQAMEIRKRRKVRSNYSDAVMQHIEQELLSQYNVDSKFDSKMRYVIILDLLLLIGVISMFVLSSPKQSWAPMFGRSVTATWNKEILNINVWASVTMLLVSIIGIVFDRNHYVGRKSVNLVFVVLSSLSLVAILFTMTVLSSL